jgi:hypothetical protein
MFYTGKSINKVSPSTGSLNLLAQESGRLSYNLSVNSELGYDIFYLRRAKFNNNTLFRNIEERSGPNINFSGSMYLDKNDIISFNYIKNNSNSVGLDEIQINSLNFDCANQTKDSKPKAVFLSFYGSSSSSSSPQNPPLVVTNLTSEMNDPIYKAYKFQISINNSWPITDTQNTTLLQYRLPNFYEWEDYPDIFYGWSYANQNNTLGPNYVESRIITGTILVNTILSYANDSKGFNFIDFRLSTENNGVTTNSNYFRLNMCFGGMFLDNRWLCPESDTCADTNILVQGCTGYAACGSIDTSSCKDGNGPFEPVNGYPPREVPPCAAGVTFDYPCLTSFNLRTKQVPNQCPGRPIDIFVIC